MDSFPEHTYDMSSAHPESEGGQGQICSQRLLPVIRKAQRTSSTPGKSMNTEQAGKNSLEFSEEVKDQHEKDSPKGIRNPIPTTKGWITRGVQLIAFQGLLVKR